MLFILSSGLSSALLPHVLLHSFPYSSVINNLISQEGVRKIHYVPWSEAALNLEFGHTHKYKPSGKHTSSYSTFRDKTGSSVHTQTYIRHIITHIQLRDSLMRQSWIGFIGHITVWSENMAASSVSGQQLQDKTVTHGRKQTKPWQDTTGMIGQSVLCVSWTESPC